MSKKFEYIYMRIKLIVIVIIMIVTVSVLVVLTFGWFSDNREAKTNTNTITIHEIAGVESSMTAFKYNNEKYMPEETDDLKLNNYDTIFVNRNLYNPLILRVKLESEKFSKGQNVILQITHDMTKDGNLNNYLSSYISSVISIKCSSELTISENDSAVNIYNTAKQYFESGDGASLSKYTFVNSHNEDYTKSESIDLTIKHSGEEIMYVYFYFNYDKDLISKYISQNPPYSLGTIIELENDIKTISVVNK